MSKETQPLGLRINRFARHLGGEIFFNIFAQGIKVEGLENIPQEGPAIAVFNHHGWAEVIAAAMGLPKDPVMFGKAETFEQPVLGFILIQGGHIPVRRGEADIRAYRLAVVALKQGQIILSSPEGTRGRDRDGDRLQLKKAKTGLIRMAIRATQEGRPIPFIPMAIWGGVETIAPEIDDKEISLLNRLKIKRAPVHVKIAEPYYVNLPNTKKLSDEDLQETADRLIIVIRDMLPPEYNGYYREDLVRYREEFKRVVRPKLEKNPQITASINQEYYSVYKAAEYRFGVPWYLLWMIHNAESGCTADPEKAYRLLHYGAMGRQQSFYPDSQVEKIVSGNYFKPFYTVPLRDRRDWKEIIWAADKIHYDAYLAMKYEEIADRNMAFEKAMHAYCPKEEAERRIERFRVLREIFSNDTQMRERKTDLAKEV